MAILLTITSLTHISCVIPMPFCCVSILTKISSSQLLKLWRQDLRKLTFIFVTFT
jgi:hypothetical protein